MLDTLNAINSYVWGLPLIVLVLGTGILLTVRLGLIQVMKLPMALKLIFSAESDGEGDVNSFKALCTALAATVGTGNIVGVATALKAGGPGALFWMWLAAFFGMATKYAECLLAVKFREVDKNGNIAGGPMHYIELGLGKSFKPLAVLFAIFGVGSACLGVGTFAQINSIVEITQIAAGIPSSYTGIALTILVAVITIGGIKSIANVSEMVVPTMAGIYFVCTLGIIITHAEQLPNAIAMVIDGAFNPTAAAGGFLGSTVMLAMRSGIARGIFSNESGLGSAPIVAAAAKTKWSAEQGLVSMTGTFIDTIIICTLTGLSLLVTGVWCGDVNGAAMTSNAFVSTYANVGPILLMIGLSLFAFTTILGWNYYGERCVEYLVGVKGILPYRVIFIVLVACGPYLKLEEIWVLSDICNGLMAFPNLIALVLLSGVVASETKVYMKHLEENKK